MSLETIVRSVSIILLLTLLILLVRRFPRRGEKLNWWDEEAVARPEGRFNPPPGWPPVPPGWVPPPGWEPDPAWPPAPPGWNFWTR